VRRSTTLPLVALVLLASLSLHAANAETTFRITDQKQQPVSDAVVSLVALDTETKIPGLVSTGPELEIEQKGQEFSPLVTAVRKGTAVRLPNRDTVEHHVYSESAPKRFQLPLYAPGKAEIIVFDRPGIVTLGCNIHDWMLAYVVVVDTPWFGRTSAAGTTTLTGVPPGHYRAEVWHRRLGSIEIRPVTIEATATDSTPIDFALTLKPDRRIRRSVEGSRGGYR
jgi:plastocyanin